jgi:hypothetical protein
MTLNVPQSRPNTCVAASAALLLSHAGLGITEQQLIAQWGAPPPRGYDLSRLSRHPALAAHDIDTLDPTALSILRALLARTWVAAVVFAGPMTVFARECVPALSSPYGPLCSTYLDRDSLLRAPTGLHVVVFCDWVERGVVAIDPWHGPDGQPFVVPRPWLARVMQGWCWSVR